MHKIPQLLTELHKAEFLFSLSPQLKSSFFFYLHSLRYLVLKTYSKHQQCIFRTHRQELRMGIAFQQTPQQLDLLQYWDVADLHSARASAWGNASFTAVS